MAEVVISFPSSLLESAELLKIFIERNGFSAWICSENPDELIENIVPAIKNCKFFIPLINEDWVLSEGRKQEYNLARKLNLTSHELKRTREPSPRYPVILPLSFSDLNWDAHPHLELLAASTTFLVHHAEFFNPENSVNIFNCVLQTIREKLSPEAISIPSLTQRISSITIRPDVTPLPPTPPPETSRETTVPSSSSSVRYPEPLRESLNVPVSIREGSKYFGTSRLSGRMDSGHYFEAWLSLELTFLNTTQPNNIHCEIIVTNLRNEIDGSMELDRQPPLPPNLRSWIGFLSTYRERCTGTYTPNGLLHLEGIDSELLSIRGLTNLTASEMNSGMYKLQSYSLVMFGNYCSGVKTPKQQPEGKTLNQEPVILQLVE